MLCNQNYYITRKLRKSAINDESKYWEHYKLDQCDMCYRVLLSFDSELSTEMTYLLTTINSFTGWFLWQKKHFEKRNIVVRVHWVIKWNRPLFLYALKLGSLWKYWWFSDENMHIQWYIAYFMVKILNIISKLNKCDCQL